MKPIVFALPGNEQMAHNIAVAIHADEGKMTIRQFPDGETYIRVQSDVNNRRTILVCTLASPDTKILPLYFLSKTLKSLGAIETCLIAPYLAYMRQDKVFKDGEGVTSEYFATLISGLADSLITVDPHLHRRESLSEIYSIPCKVIHASALISKYIMEYISNPLLIGPDAESEQWVSDIAKNANAPFIILKKTRLGDIDVKISVPQIEKFKNHTPVLVDDIISTARTMIETVRHLRNAGMIAPVCIGVHPVFAGNAFKDLLNSGVAKIVSSNSIAHSSNQIDLAYVLANELNMGYDH